MSEAMLLGGMDFDALLESVLRERRAQAGPAAGFTQRLKATLAQEAARRQQPRFAFAESVRTRRSAVSMWTAVMAHVAALALVLTLTVMHPRSQLFAGAKKSVQTVVLTPLPLAPPSVSVRGGGGGAHNLAEVTKGHLPRLAQEQILAPKIPAAVLPKLTVEPSVVVQPDLKMANNALPDLGMPNAPAAMVGSLGKGSGGGIGSSDGTGIGMGSGGNTGGGVYHIGSGVRAPEVIAAVDPEYSEEARKARYDGNVLVDLIVDERGMPSHVHVVRGTGMGLDEKAVEAVRQYRFKPAKKDGRPVKVQLDIEVNFQIF